MKIIYDVKNCGAEASIKDVDGKKGIVTGYFNAFGNVDSDGDIIRQGAFTKTIQQNGPKSQRPRHKHLQNHNTSQPIGKLLELKEDAKGLYYESQTGTHMLGVDFIKMVESGLITEHSIGFKTLKRNQLQDYEDYQKSPEKGWYEITEVKLWEGSSLTAWGANELTPVTGLKGLDEDYLQDLINKQTRIEKFCYNTDASDETIELLLLENKQLTQIICDLKETIKPADKAILPGAKEFKEAVENFINTL